MSFKNTVTLQDFQEAIEQAEEQGSLAETEVEVVVVGAEPDFTRLVIRDITVSTHDDVAYIHVAGVR